MSQLLNEYSLQTEALIDALSLRETALSPGREQVLRSPVSSEGPVSRWSGPTNRQQTAQRGDWLVPRPRPGNGVTTLAAPGSPSIE